VFTGDLMDRGPDPVGCVKFVRKSGFVCIKGNHEDKHLRWHKHQEKYLATGKKNPVQLSPLGIQQNQQLSDRDLAWMKDLPVVLSLPNNWVAVHGGFEPAYAIKDQKPDRMLRCRFVLADGTMKGFKDGNLNQPPETFFWADRWNGPESVVFGHAVHKNVTNYLSLESLNDFRCVALDTGCVYGGKLSALIIEGEKYTSVSVDALKVHYNKKNPFVEGRAM
jgi:bis(5'-nucleosyl)-tetraphosphatase (symmetrical)